MLILLILGCILIFGGIFGLGVWFTRVYDDFHRPVMGS
jgi:hypothetical protein